MGSVNIKKVFAVTLAVYVALTVGFYFLAGEQLKYRSSRGNTAMPAAETITAELCSGATVEQTFSARIQRLKTVGVQFGTYYRPNTGTVTMELFDAADGTLLMSRSWDAGETGEGQTVSMTSDEPVEGVYARPLLLRLTADSEPGYALSPLMSASASAEGGALTINGEPTPGVLCFTAEGEDYIWTGLHYWQFVGILGAAIAAVFAAVLLRLKKGKRSYIFNALTALSKYRFLIRQLVSRDFKTKYRRSVLGVFWSFLNPLLMMTVQYFVFSTIFKSDTQNYPVYLMIGIVSFNFFSEVCGMSLTSVIGNANLITKVYMPKYIYPLTRTMSSAVNFAISLVPLFIVAAITGLRLHAAAPLALFFWVCLMIFSLGLGVLLSASMVFFRDTQFLWNVLSTVWMYVTPIFYPESIVPQKLRILLRLNPLYHFLTSARSCILYGVSPEPATYVSCFAMALAMLLVGAAVFKKTQDKFVLYL
ncbi:MAG: ABC transporter permease [Oscillospiraceae bacterium]|nr:ABC transporter permease [Oscillospiraceae bacterium]